MKRLAGLRFVAVCLGAAAVPAAASQAEDPRIVAARATRAPDIAALRTSASDATRAAETRVQSLKALALIDEREGLALAESLIGDSDASVAAAAVELLASSVVLLGHGSHGTTPGPWAARIDAERQTVSAALERASADGRPVIAKGALRGLASLSHPQLPDKVSAGVRANLLTANEAAGLCAQAEAHIGRACLIELLDNSTEAGKRAAVTSLASRAAERVMVRNKILFNDKAEIGLRAAAAESLGKYDPAFASYGPLLAADLATPPALFATVLKAHARNLEATGGLSSIERSQLMKAIDNKIADIKLHSPPDRAARSVKPLVDLKTDLKSQ